MLKRILVAFVLLIGPAVAPGAASAHHNLAEFDSAVAALSAVDPTIDPPPNDSRIDFVVGGGENLDQDFGLSAHSGPLGEDPFGHASATLGQPDTLQYRARVTCLTVAGNLAAVGLVPTDAQSNDFGALQLVLAIRDSGLPGGTGDGIQIVSAGNAQNCAAFVAAAAVADPLDRGNLLVHDAL
jgi:hypothetical protein